MIEIAVLSCEDAKRVAVAFGSVAHAYSAGLEKLGNWRTDLSARHQLFLWTLVHPSRLARYSWPHRSLAARIYSVLTTEGVELSSRLDFRSENPRR